MKKLDDLLHQLTWRNILKDIANKENLEEIINSKSAFYIGIDPTADSMHIGHYSNFILAKIISLQGMTPVFIVGEFTASIGDPSGKNEERKIIDNNLVSKNARHLEEQIKLICSKLHIDNFKVVSNIEFYKNMNIIELYQQYGKLFNVNQMLAKEMVKNRLDSGISYTEFSYQIFQAIDFLKLFEKYNVKLQLGGSDQWGNIVSGTELIRKVKGPESLVAGMTINLVTDRNGNKIGKTSSGNTIWLREDKTSSYEMYQYFYNSDDQTAISLLPKLTLINEQDYKLISQSHLAEPHKRIAQNELAKRVISQIYSEKHFDEAKTNSEYVFSEQYEKLSEKVLMNILSIFPSIKLNGEEKIIDLLVNNGIVSSKREVRNFINDKAIKINNEVILDENRIVSSKDLIKNTVGIISVGKKKKFAFN